MVMVCGGYVGEFLEKSVMLRGGLVLGVLRAKVYLYFSFLERSRDEKLLI